MNSTRDQVYEYLRHLDYSSIKSLCQSDRYYWDLCHTDTFKQLIVKKYLETNEYKVKQQIQQIQNLQGDDYIHYEFENNLPRFAGFRDNRQYIDFTNDNLVVEENYVVENDNTRRLGYKNTWLFKLLDRETGFSKLSQQDLLSYAQRLDQEGCGYLDGDGNPYNAHLFRKIGPIILLPEWIKEHNLNYSVYDYHHYVVMNLINPTSKQLQELLTMINEESEPKISLNE